MAFAGSIEAQPVVAAILEFTSACAQAAVVTRPAWVAVARMCVRVTLAVSTTIIWALLCGAVFACPVWSAVALASMAFPVWLIAVILATWDRAVKSGESFLAVALFGPLVTHSISTALVGADVNACFALDTSKPGCTQAVSVVALSAIDLAIVAARFLGTGLTLPANLAQACGIVAAITILAIWANWLGAVNATVANIAFTASGNAIAATMPGATVGAHFLLASFAHESGGAIAGSVHTATVGRAVTWAALQRAVITGPTHLAHAMRSHTITVTIAIVGAWSTGAIHTGVS